MKKNLKDELYHFSETPPDQVWTKIDAHYKAKSTKRILFYTISLIALLAVGLYSIFQTDMVSKNRSEVADSGSKKIESNQELSQTTISEKDTKVSSEMKLPQPGSENIQPDHSTIQTNPTKSFQSFEKVGKSERRQKTNQVSQVIPAEKFDRDYLSEITLASVPIQFILTDLNLKMSERTDHPIIPIDEFIPKPCPKVGFFAGVTAGTGLTNFIRKDNEIKSLMENFNIQTPSNPVGTVAQSYSAGITGGITLPKGFFLSLGASYSHLSVKNNSSIFLYPFNSGNFLNTSLIPTASGDVSFEPTVDDLGANALTGGTMSGTIHQNFGFLSIPLKIGKTFGKKRLQYSIAVGSALNYKLLNQARFVTEYNESREITPAGIGKLNASIGIEPGISYRISGNLALNAGIDFNYTLTNMSLSQSYRLNNYSVGLNLGIRWISKSCH